MIQRNLTTAALEQTAEAHRYTGRGHKLRFYSFPLATDVGTDVADKAAQTSVTSAT